MKRKTSMILFKFGYETRLKAKLPKQRLNVCSPRGRTYTTCAWLIHQNQPSRQKKKKNRFQNKFIFGILDLELMTFCCAKSEKYIVSNFKS